MTARRWFNRVARYGIAALLTAVACGQLYLSHRHDLPSWLGGGMGMFATVDRVNHRLTRAQLTTSDEPALVVDLGSAARLGPMEMRARVMPTDDRLDDLARAIARHGWRRESAGESAVARGQYGGGPGALEPTAVRVEVWRVEFDSPQRAATMRLIGERTVPITTIRAAPDASAARDGL